MRSVACLAIAAFVGSLTLAGCSSADPNGGEAEGNASEQGVARPPQFVLLAFDGSLNLDFWEESRRFAKENNVKWTYFISGVYFLANEKKAAYHAPHHSVGSSDIGFGGASSDVPLRVKQVIGVHEDGHEIASHANGHYDGTTWTAEDWESEFDQFDQLVFEAGGKNGVDVADLPFDKRSVVGFRAPLLGQGPGLYKALANRGFAYDTSMTAAPNYWPENKNGVWNFPLARLRIVGSGRSTLSMDYNFYFADSKGLPDSANKATYKKQMIDTYMQYFQGNYVGNRAPVHIGHHFAKWNGGAYWEAMQEFAKRVCTLPEVTCGTYRDLLAFVTEHKEHLPLLQAGKFPKMAGQPSAKPPADTPSADELIDAGLHHAHSDEDEM